MTNETDTVSVWTPYEPDDDAPWNQRRVVHLHRRAGFGACWSEIERDLADGPQESVTRVLNGNARGEGVPEGFAHLADIIGNAAVDSGSAERLKAWWLYRCLFSPHPLEERLTLMWHNHFATSNLKVNDLRLMKQQNDTLRTHAFGPFGDMLRDMAHDPALLEWLDAPSNRAGMPNENLARELMELFTLGIGNYSEQDIKQAARALTGWTVRQGQFRSLENAHDDGEKSICGRAGNWDGDDLAGILLEQPAIAHRLAWRLTNEFFGENVVSESALAELAAGLQSHNLDIRWAVETILRSELFFSDTNIASRVCDPVTFVIAPLRAIECWDDPPSTLVLAEWVGRMGQDLFYPPNVGGWNGGRAWLSTRTVVARANYATALAEGTLRSPPEPPDLAALCAQHNIGSVLQSEVGFLADLLLGGIPQTTLDEIIESAASQSAKRDGQLRSALIRLLARPEAQLV